LATASIASTETFDGFPSPTYFYTQEVVIDGVSYRTDQTAAGNMFAGNPLWTVGVHLGAMGYVSAPNDFGTNFIGTDQISFGTNNYVKDFGFFMLTSSTFPQPYDVSVTEIDGAISSFSISSEQDYFYVGFTSTTGIRELTIVNAPFTQKSNFSFDDVLRGSLQSIPEPSSLVILSVGLAIVLVYHSKRRANRVC